MGMEQDIARQVTEALEALTAAGGLHAGSLLVVGCSTSEIVGEDIGKGSVPALGPVVAGTVISFCVRRGIVPVFQCCEHLNRALVMERAEAEKRDLTLVNAVPQPKAGGSFATTAYRRFREPAVLEEIRADAGLDIGDTLIGMQLKKVAVPLRLEHKQIGKAHLAAARTRPKFIGGERAVYDDRLK